MKNKKKKKNDIYLPSLNGTREDTTECVETTLIRGRHHLRDEDDERTVGIAVLERLRGDVVERASVEARETILLRLGGRWQMHDHHLEQRLVRRQPLLHDGLHELLAGLFAIGARERHAERADHLLELVKVVGHAEVDDLADRLEHELRERALERLAIVAGRVVLPLLGGRVVVRLAPQARAQLVGLNAKLLRIDARELVQRKRPAYKRVSRRRRKTKQKIYLP